MIIVVGDFSGNGETPLHKDNDNHINAIVSVGENKIKGGMTVYYSGVNANN